VSVGAALDDVNQVGVTHKEALRRQSRLHASSSSSSSRVGIEGG
jgi:hypothetical protein